MRIQVQTVCVCLCVCVCLYICVHLYESPLVQMRPIHNHYPNIVDLIYCFNTLSLSLLTCLLTTAPIYHDFRYSNAYDRRSEQIDKTEDFIRGLTSALFEGGFVVPHIFIFLCHRVVISVALVCTIVRVWGFASGSMQLHPQLGKLLSLDCCRVVLYHSSFW